MHLYATPGITEPNLTPEPLGSEGEMTQGPDDLNPFRSERERRELEDITGTRGAVQDEYEEVFVVEDPAADPDPYAWDDVSPVLRGFEDGDPFMFYAEETGVTFRSIEDPSYGPEQQYVIENASGGTADYRARLISAEEIK